MQKTDEEAISHQKRRSCFFFSTGLNFTVSIYCFISRTAPKVWSDSFIWWVYTIGFSQQKMEKIIRFWLSTVYRIENVEILASFLPGCIYRHVRACLKVSFLVRLTRKFLVSDLNVNLNGRFTKFNGQFRRVKTPQCSLMT